MSAKKLGGHKVIQKEVGKWNGAILHPLRTGLSSVISTGKRMFGTKCKWEKNYHLMAAAA